MKPVGEFDNDYRKNIQDACLKAILEASIDPATNTAMLRISATLVAGFNEANGVSLTLGTQSAIPCSTQSRS